MTDYDLESVWEYREESLYPKLFGSNSNGIFVLTHEIFARYFDSPTVDPRWLFYGVFEFEPTPSRKSWLYVTSGASNPWDADPREYDSASYSGLGTEIVFETTAQSQWAIVLVQRMLAFNILLCHGRFGERGPLDYWDRVPVRGPINSKADCRLEALIISPPATYPETAVLPSGKFDFLHLIGISATELEYAKQHGSSALVDCLTEKGAAPITDPKRAPLSCQ